MMDLWKYQDDAGKFNELDIKRQQEIVDVLLTEEAASRYNYASMLRNVISNVDDALAFRLFTHFIKNGVSFSYEESNIVAIVQGLYDKDGEKTKSIIKTSKDRALHGSLLMLDGITHGDEEIGLRALSGMKYAPDGLFINKYKPSVEAVKKLPPVMRLKALEALLSNDDVSYNVFENFAKPDEFKSLLFGAVLRHNDRVNMVWDKYNEILNRATKSTTKIHGNCEICGEYDIIIKSTRVGTEAGLNNTRLGHSLRNSGCALCGRWGQHEKQVVL